MNNQDDKLKVVIGLGKTGISCLRYLHKHGYNVAGVDSRSNPPSLAELESEFSDLPLHFGDFNAPFMADADELVVSPGVSLKTPEIAAEIARGVKIAGDIELFVRAVTAPIVAITGSNGKSSVTTLVGDMAKAAGLEVGVGGNLGTPALDLMKDTQAQLYVLELSSFQLETTSSLQAKAAVILNISEDHMDRYADLKEYIAAKQRIYNGAEWGVINRDDPVSFAGVQFSDPNQVKSFGLGAPETEDQFGIVENHLVQGTNKLLPLKEIKVKGMHQAANALAALALGQAANLPMEAMLQAIRDFKGLRHRCAYIRTINGVDYYNDSKGTNVGATQAAIAGIGPTIDGKIVLIAGGLGKGADFSVMSDDVKKYVSTVVLIGKDAPIIEKDLAGCAEFVHADTLQDALLKSQANAKAGDVVLLSPACASFDMFKNFEVRGEDFEKLVEEM